MLNTPPFLTAFRPWLIGLTMAGYLLVYFCFQHYLPEKWFLDSGKLASIAGQGVFEDNSFGMTAWLLNLLPDGLWYVLIPLFGCLTIYALAGRSQTWSTLGGSLLVLAPTLLLNHLVPSKETIVIALSLLVMSVIDRWPRLTNIILIVVLAYLIYGLNVRSYYVLILLVFLLLITLRFMPWRGFVLLGFVALLGLLFIPPDVFWALQGQRDTANYYATYINQSDIRTGFENPFEPTSAWAFVLNYLYAGFVLTFPLVLFVSLKEIIMLACVWFCGWMCWWGMRQSQVYIYGPSCLFLAHILVLWLFEPDFGSYLRHFSSVLLYLAPAVATFSWRREATVS